MRITEVLTESSKICPQCGMRGCPCKPGKCNCKPKPGYPKKIDEAANPAQQAAIAIAMKKAGKKPKSVAEGSEESIPSILYHATYKPRLKSIGLKGLGAGGKRNWEDSKRGVVYLALDPYVAESYAETSDMVPDEWLDQIVILKISTAGLDPNKFGIDSNVQDNAGDTVEYHGVIPLKNISLYKQGVAEGFYDSNPATYDLPRRILNVPELIRRGAIFVTYPHDEPGWETDAQEDWQLGLISLYNVAKGPAWSVEAKKYLKPKSYKRAEQQINSSAPNLGSDKLVYDGKYNQILWSIKKLGIPNNVAFLDKDKQAVSEGGPETTWSDDTDTITLQDILELTKHIKQINLPINDNLKSKLLHWEGNPEEIERVNQVTVSNQFPILIMVDKQGQIEWILDGNHRLHKAIQSQAKTIPAKLIKPSDLNDKAKKIFNIKEQGVAEGAEHNNLTADKIFFARSNKTPKGWSYDHVGFITQDGKQIQMSGHKGNDVYVTNSVTDDPEFPKQNIKIVSLSKPVSVPTTNSVGAENCGTFVANVLQANGIKGIDTQKIYSVFKKPQKQGVAEGVPQSGPSSGAPKQFGADAQIQTRQMTVKDIISSIPGVPYYNNVVDDWDAKDYSWGVTKKVIEYATYLKDHPESLPKLPPAIVLNGKFEDGAHRVSAIWLLQQRMDPKNPLWKNTKLNVQFVKQGVAEGTEQSLSSMAGQDQAERNAYEAWVKAQPGATMSAEMGAKYAQLKNRSKLDIFGDAVRQDKFMKMKFDFDKFTAQDWKNYWTLAQHCDKNRDFQKNALSIIKKYQGTDHKNYKFLYDRISMGLTGKQKYGTQNGPGYTGEFN